MMKSFTNLNYLAFIAAVILSFNAFAYDDDKKKEICRQPKIQEFTLPEYSETNKKEAQPEEEFTFVVSGWADAKKFKMAIKGKPIPFTVQSTETFHKIKAKIPAEFTGQTIRINARIPAILGCYSTIGWLVKVADKANADGAQKPDVAVELSGSTAEAPAPSAESGKSDVVDPQH